MSSDATRPEDEHRSPSLVSLAQGFGISTEYYSFFGDLVQVPAATLRSVLSAMGVATFTDAQIDQARAGKRPLRIDGQLRGQSESGQRCIV